MKITSFVSLWMVYVEVKNIFSIVYKERVMSTHEKILPNRYFFKEGAGGVNGCRPEGRSEANAVNLSDSNSIWDKK